MDRNNDLGQVWDDRAYAASAHFTKHPFLWIAGFVAFCIGLSLIGNAVGVVSWYWRAEQAKLTVKPRVTVATYGTGNALANIAYFHNQCNTVLADQQNVINAKGTLLQDKATFAATTDPIAQEQAGQSVNQDQTALLGAKDQLSNDVRDYDAKSATQTANPFKAHNLPYRIQLNPTTGLLQGAVNCK